jgi:hypothetical protein
MKAHSHETPATTTEAVVLTFIYSALVVAYIFLGLLFR